MGESFSLGERKAEDQNPDGIPYRHRDNDSDTDTSEFLFSNKIKIQDDT